VDTRVSRPEEGLPALNRRGAGKSMNRSNVASTAVKVFKLLEPFASDDRHRIVKAAMTLVGEPLRSDEGDDESSTGGDRQGEAKRAGGRVDAKTFFDQKEPSTKIEELAVAARFRELNDRAVTSHDREDLKKVIEGARRNFDAKELQARSEQCQGSGPVQQG